MARTSAGNDKRVQNGKAALGIDVFLNMRRSSAGWKRSAAPRSRSRWLRAKGLLLAPIQRVSARAAELLPEPELSRFRLVLARALWREPPSRHNALFSPLLQQRSRAASAPSPLSRACS